MMDLHFWVTSHVHACLSSSTAVVLLLFARTTSGNGGSTRAGAFCVQRPQVEDGVEWGQDICARPAKKAARVPVDGKGGP